ncbi:MAG: hypothetical protein V2B18_13405, partial [Pseudomonadota bacterium]
MTSHTRDDSRPCMVSGAFLGRALVLVTVSLAVWPRFSACSVWDDAYIVLRYADNIIKYGEIVWNADGGPTFGGTSLLYLLPVTGIRYFLPHDPALVLCLAAAISGVPLLILLDVLVFRSPIETGLSRGVRTFIICVAASLSLLYWSFHFVTGMDTTFAMAYAALYLLTIERY